MREMIKSSPEMQATLTVYRGISANGFDLNEVFDHDGSDEGWVRELIGHCEIFRRVLEIRHTQIEPKFAEIRQILTQVEVLSARQIESKLATPIDEAVRGPMVGLAQVGILYFPQFDRRLREQPSDLTGLIERAGTLLAECENIDRGETDEAGPEVNWDRLDRMMMLARSGSLRFRIATDDAIPYTKAREKVAESDPWLSNDPRAVRAHLDQLKKNLGSIQSDLAHRKRERWLTGLREKSQRLILKEVWPILQTAEGPLTRSQITKGLRTHPDDSSWQSLAAVADRGDPDAPLWNRKRETARLLHPRPVPTPHRPIKVDFAVTNSRFVFLSFPRNRSLQ